MSSMPERLAVIDSCDGCGVCCNVVSRPPFYRVFDESGEDAWERLKADRPDVVAELHADYSDTARSRRSILRHALYLV